MTRFRPALLCLVILLAAASAATAQKPRVYDFLRNDASARSAAMGGTFVTVTGDPVGLFYNPASLQTIDSSQAAFTFLKHLLDINSGFLAASTRYDGVPLGIGVNYVNYGSFERVDRMGRALGEFGSSDLAVTLGWASELGEGFSAGVAGKAVFSHIDDYNSSALALDAGLIYVDTSDRVQAGLAILNLGSQIDDFNGVKEDLPLDLTVGVSHSLRGLPLLIGLNFHRLLDDYDTFFERLGAFSIGGEFTISRPIRLRFGYDNAVRRDIAFGESKGLAGMSVGFGVVVKSYRFDYAFNSLARLGGMHLVTINAAF